MSDNSADKPLLEHLMDADDRHRDPRGEISAEIRDAVRQLRADMMNEMDELRGELESLQRVLNSRTEHLA